MRCDLLLSLPALLCLIGAARQASGSKDSSEVGEESLSLSEEVTQWWGEWSSWSTCSRTCGGGVRSHERHCLQQRLFSAQNISTTVCVGSPKHYELCPDQPCRDNRISFKQQQCSAFNAKPFGRRYYTWIPLYPDDYISISSKPCDLQCTATTGERQLLVQAQDGTHCRDGVYDGVCIGGQCQMVGCDGNLHSARRLDKCGVCGGSGASCYRVSGSFRKGFTQLGYLFITNVPAGAKDIQIIERRKTENILALADEGGHFFFNGNFVIDNPRNFFVAGTVFKYRRPANLFSDGFEYIIAQGPTNVGLNVMYYNLNGKMPHVTYEYTMPRSFEVRTAVPVFSSLEVVENFTSVPGVVFFQRSNEVLQEKLQGGGLPNFGSESNRIHGTTTSHNGSHHPPKPLLGSLFFSIFSKSSTLKWPSWNASSCPNGRCNTSTPLDNTLSLEIYDSSASPHRPASDEDGVPYSLLNVSVPPLKVHQVESVQGPKAESNEFEPASPDISLADMYRWKVSAYAPCSSTCTTGVSASYAMCVRYDGSEVDEGYCDALTRPEPTHEFCSGQECPPRWETSRWSECSRTCGQGYQFRTVRCWKMLAPGFDSSVYDELCQVNQTPKPMARKACRSRSCGPQWEISDWSECLARCGERGVQTRGVRCSTDAHMCNGTARPQSEKECEGPPCDRRWTVSEWGPCSGPCGEGRMSRYVVCKSADGHVLSDARCDRDLKPLGVYPCGDRSCQAHWVEQEWEQCNATCGRGVKTRQVVCSGLENGGFKEYPEHTCDLARKPEESAPCFARPCTKWFTTSWSQCSKTCGSGVRVREVKCYQGEELGHSCDVSLKPEARQMCEVQPCPTEAPDDEMCQDKPTANCGLVLKVKLCKHWYYRKACCQSCRGKGQP